MHDTYHDLETYCATPIKDGTHRYAEDAEVLLWAFAGAKGEPRVWDLRSKSLWEANEKGQVTEVWRAPEDSDQLLVPRPLWDMLNDPEALVWFHNGAAFDFVVLDRGMPWFTRLVPPARRRDTMVQAYCHALPGALDKLGAILKLNEDDQKLKDEGKRYIQLFCKPQANGTYNHRESHPEEWVGFVRYAARDIITMRAARRLMPQWNYREGKQMDLWQAHLRMTCRGMFTDRELAEAAIDTAEREKKRMARRVNTLTAGAVAAATQRDKLLNFLKPILAEHGVDLPDLTADTIERRLDDENLPASVKELMLLRLRASMNSVSKYKTLVRGVNSDGRLRGCSQFRGAGRTGRTAHRMFQPGNLPRPAYKDYAFIETGIEAIKAGCLDLVTDNVMEMCASAVRGVIVAPPGKKLVIADLSNIEGRVAAWLAGEHWKLDAFRAYDAGEGPDLYVIAYCKSFNVALAAWDGDKNKRQIGKVEELMFQYEGGVGAWITGAATYGIDLDAMTEAVYPTLPPDVVGEAESFLHWRYGEATEAFRKRTLKLKARRDAGPTEDVDPTNWALELDAEEARSQDRFEADKLLARMGLPEKTFVTCDSLKRLWRRAHPAIVSYWAELKDTVIEAINNPGATLTARKIKVRRDGQWLRLGLPSGRALCYPNPRLTKDGAIAYTGQNPYTKTWGEVKTYGGKIFENCLSRGTLVLTSTGWVPIIDVTVGMRVWDGEEWVSHEGCIYRGNRTTITTFGVRMTPDHKVLTTEGWRCASSCEGHHRANCGLPDGYPVPRQRRSTIALGRGMSVWQDPRYGRQRLYQVGEAREHQFMWLHEGCNDQRAQHKTRNVTASALRRVAQHARSVCIAFASCMGELRRAGDQGLRTLARGVQQLLVGHGSLVFARTDAGAQGQQPGLLSNELRMGDTLRAGPQHPEESTSTHPCRHDDVQGGCRTLRREVHHAALATGQPLANGESVESVFDLINCGPRHRFVVWGDGAPLIVHNCVQAVANDQFLEPLPAIEEAGFEPVLDIHDEWVCEADAARDDLSADRLAGLMCMDLGWNVGLPLAAAGFETDRYHKE